jgi:predicted dehydrogenase
VQSTDLGEVLDRTRPDIVVLTTPIHTHADLALVAAEAGAHILLEKPPAPTLAAFRRIDEGVRAAGVVCQVGFQSLGSSAVARAAELVRGGELGVVHGISAAGAWHRDSDYFGRAAWTGRRTLGGIDVVDGALTNPFAHALATAFQVDGSSAQAPAPGIEVELWHAYDIDSDDTACLRLISARGTIVTVAVTLCAADPGEPYIVIHGERGRAVLWYTRDVLEVDGSVRRPDSWPEGEGREDLLENLIGHLSEPRTPLIAPLSTTLAFMHAVEAVRQASAPRTIPLSYVNVSPLERDGVRAERRTVIGVDAAVAASADRLALFSELDLPWAGTSPVSRSGVGGVE